MSCKLGRIPFVLHSLGEDIIEYERASQDTVTFQGDSEDGMMLQWEKYMMLSFFLYDQIIHITFLSARSKTE